jgi:hypothetical protein
MEQDKKKQLTENFKRLTGISLKESDMNAQDWDDAYTNENLVVFLRKWLGALRFYDDERKSKIIAKALEDEFPNLTV